MSNGTVPDAFLAALPLRRAYDSDGTLLPSRTDWRAGSGVQFTDTANGTVVSQDYGDQADHPPVAADRPANAASRW